MAKWFGKVGYDTKVEIEPGIWKSKITEVEYFGDITSNRWRHQKSENVNDDVNISNVISIVADQFAYTNCSNMVYVEYMGIKWKITDVDIQPPRLILSMGGVYNGPQT